MSVRSPTPDGLVAGSPNAPGFVNNPAAIPEELQAHHYWGRYSLTTFLPNVGFVDGVAVAGLNPAAAPAYTKLRPGDLGFVEGLLPPVVSNLYVCVDRGTVSGNNARWVTLGNAAIPPIRDAHVIVVGQTGAAAPLSGAAFLAAVTPPGANAPMDGLNLSGVGEIVSVTCDYLDIGNGAELQRALAAASAGGVAIDIRLRPCDITLPAAAVGTDGFRVPANCRLIGAGRASSRLTGGDGTGTTEQVVVTLEFGASIEDLSVASPAPAVVPATTILGVVHMEDQASALRCDISLSRAIGGNPPTRFATAAIWAPLAVELVNDCGLFVAALTVPSYGVRIGDPAAAYRLEVDWEVRNTVIYGAGNLIPARSASHAVWSENVEGGRIYNCEHQVAAALVGVDSISFGWEWALPGEGPVVIRGPKIHGCHTIYAADNGADATAFLVRVAGAQDIAGVSGSEIHDCSVEFTSLVNALYSKTAFLIKQASTAVGFGAIYQSTLDNCKARNAQLGVVIDASAVAPKIISVRVQSCQVRDPKTGGLVVPKGALLSGGTVVNVNDVGIHNCDFSDAPATGFGVRIDSANVDDTIVLGNHLRPNGGTALSDLGTGTEAAHNIVV